MGLKQMVAKAMQDEAPALPPVDVSGEALKTYSAKVREWSGWPDATLRFGVPGSESPWARVDHSTHEFVANVDLLLLNPHRILHTVTPFRMRQEAVLTGSLLHEAGHARHSHWKPANPSEVGKAAFMHSDGSEPSKPTLALATLMEEPRVEGLMAQHAGAYGATGLDWTMRASAAHLLPTTDLSEEPDQQIMDLITSWTLRAGRQIALNARTGLRTKHWVQEFTTLLAGAIEAHIFNALSQDPNLDIDFAEEQAYRDRSWIMDTLLEMIKCDADKGPFMIDQARAVLALLFPNGNPDDAPEPQAGCGMGMQTGEDGEGEEADDPDGEEGSGDSKSGVSGNGDDGKDDDAEGEGNAPKDDSLAQKLAAMEADAKDEAEDEAEDMSVKSTGGTAGGPGGDGNMDDDGFRYPTKEERDVQRNAERFLRGLINPTEASKVTLTDSPAATVDGAALAAWKAGGQVRAPHFFKRTKRDTTSSPPVKIAILVDTSGSMDELQEPSALLSWALASAAIDLKNFAGRGAQVESTLIHWGDDARVIQENGKPLPGIREVGCYEGTYAMAEAYRLVEEQIPGFFAITEKPVNRLLVHFTDWELSGLSTREMGPYIKQSFAAGVNMLSVVPKSYGWRRSDLATLMDATPVQRGSNTVLKYNPMFPEQVWDTAAEALS